MSITTKVRRLARRSLKPFVMLGIAMTLALSLTVTTTQRAEATPAVAVAPVIAAAEGVLAGGVRLALPSLLSIAIATNPVGWAIGAGIGIAAVGVGLYSTKDYWLPYVSGLFGSPDNNNPAGAVGAAQPNILAGLSLVDLSLSGGQSGSLSVKWSYNFTSQSWATQVWVNCRTTAGALSVVNQSISGASNGALQTRVFPINCPSGQVMTGAVAGPGAAHAAFPSRSSVPGPENVMTAGSYSPAGFDPRGADVKYKTTVECIDAAGTRASLSAESAGNEGGVKVPSCAAAGLGHATGKMDVDGYAPTAPGIPGTVPERIWSAPAPVVAPDHPQRLCDPNRPGDGCKMAITIDGKPCTVGAWECENWTEIWKDPNTAPRVGCTYGPYAMAVDLCKVMEPAYRPGGAPATEENMDADPATRNYTQPGGTTYTPPATGTGTAPGGFPTTGTNPAPTSSPNCAAPEWSWNPVDFVKNPVLCALQDAFVPKMDVQARSNDLQQKSTEVVPISWLSNPISGPGGSGCPNWTVHVAGLSENVVCNSSFTQALTAVRTPLFGLVAAAMVWPLLRGIWYASIPVLRVTPGSSK